MTLRRVLAASAAMLLFSASVFGSTRYDPRLRFRTISTPRFDIHFHQGEEQQARRLAEIAEDVAVSLDRVLGRPSGRVQVILVNQTDLPNGWATPLPYNIIEITAAAPSGESTIGNTDDWLRLVFTHEYTHVVHLGRAGGWIGGLRRVFGRMPLLFPNLALPLWQIEGIATYQESALTGQGRLYAGDFRLIPEGAAAAGRFLPIDRANGGLVDWPGGQAPYAYGGLFHEYLASRFGAESVRRLTDTSARQVPYFGTLAFRKVFNRSLGELWKEFRVQSAQQYASQRDSPVAVRLTHHGFTVGGPRFGPDGGLYYSIVNPHGFPSLMKRTSDGATREVATRYLGSRVGFAGPEVVFDQFELVQQVAVQADLYAVRADGSGLRRLTREARAQDPDVSPDGRTIVCTLQRADGRTLARMAVPADGQFGAPVPVNDAPNTDWGAPRWSPDGRWIAAERRALRGPSEIVVVDPENGAVRTLVSSHEVRNVSPAWTRDSRHVLFTANRMHGAFELFRIDIATGAVERLAATGPSAQWPEVSPDGTTLVYVGYTNDGYDLFSIDLTKVQWSLVKQDAGARGQGPGTRTADDSSARNAPAETAQRLSVAERAYFPLPTLIPTFWTPTIESDNSEIVVGGATAGYDALGRHAYGITAGWSASRVRPDWHVAYAYDRWWPTMFAEYSDDTDPFRRGELRTREANAGVLLPVRRVRWSSAVLGAFHTSTDEFTRESTDGPERARALNRAVRAGFRVDAARSYGYSISDEEGWSVTTGVELTRSAFGADGNAGAATIDLRAYVPLAPRHAVVAIRAGVASAWGDEDVRRVFTAGGSGPQSRDFEFGSDAVGLLRGVDESDLIGDHAAVVNLDYRVPLARIERGVGTLPFFVRTVHGAVFADFGEAWNTRFRAGEITRSVGAELSIDTVLGYALPLTFTGGLAWQTLDERGGPVFFARIGRGF